MSYILIGSSNVCWFYKPETFKDYKTYTMVRTVRLKPFKARVACMEEREKEVMISAIENFICDKVGSDPDKKNPLNENIEKVHRDFTKKS
jgi:hypothetical protein